MSSSKSEKTVMGLLCPMDQAMPKQQTLAGSALVLIALTACSDPKPTRPTASAVPQPAVAASDTYCLASVYQLKPALSDGELRRLYLHYAVCVDDRAEADRILRVRVERGDAEAMYLLALSYFRDGGTENEKKGHALMKRAKAAGSPQASEYPAAGQ